MLGLLSKDSSVLSPHLSNNLRSVCKLISTKIQKKILDSVLQVFRKQVILEIGQADYLPVIADESTNISGQTQLDIILGILISNQVR